ncbi:aminopeptidase P family protein [Rhodospirillaceae bacterium KN72]|uniref:Aminopeptidase P family protein n=1 Tax=Pacificispira spongiicola TaxID=2729598 RepID=A0A7Y0DWF4_9PROT|nr:Xaa-Pro peptidase family protein [Pacificispira spongiicola]NMM42844.1 aminopeptidase P family protein [Pacificispira spongiicola]
MSFPARGFPKSEFESRTRRAQDAMAEQDLSAILLTTEPDIRYFTGFLTRFWESPTRPWYLVLPASGPPIAVIPSIGAALMATTWISDIRTWRAPDLTDDGIGLLADTLVEVAGPAGRIGTPMGHETLARMPLADLKRLEALLSPRVLSDDGWIVKRQRQIKSPAEIDKIEAACRIADRAFARLPEIVRVGVPLADVFRKFQILCLEEGADWVPYLAGGAGQGGYADVISPATETPLASGDILMLDTGLVWDGYFCDFDRNVAVERADAASMAAHAKLIEAVDAAMAIAKPGARACDLFHAMDRIVTGGAGGSDAGRLGHGLGMQLTEVPSLIPADRTELAEGMVLTLEPGIETGDGRIMVHEENIVVTADGARMLSTPCGSDLRVI